MKRLYTAFLEGGMDIDEAVVLLRSGGENGEMDEKDEMKKKNEKIETWKRGGIVASVGKACVSCDMLVKKAVMLA